MAKPKLGLDRLTPDEKVAFVQTVITSMTGNPSFPTPNPTLAATTTGKNNLLTGINDYNASVVTTQTKLATRDTYETVVDGLMTQLAAYVENASGGDRVKIESAGFSVRSDATPVGALGAVLNLVLTAGDDEGTLDAAWDPLRGSNSYEVHISVDPVSGTSWQFKSVAGKSSITLNGLTSGTKIWVRVRGIGAGNATGTWSDPAVKTVP